MSVRKLLNHMFSYAKEFNIIWDGTYTLGTVNVEMSREGIITEKHD